MSTRNNILSNCAVGGRNLVYYAVLIAYLSNRIQRNILGIPYGKPTEAKRGDILWQNQV
jgi:hypothetical protein